jgi:hypothetical protein
MKINDRILTTDTTALLLINQAPGPQCWQTGPILLSLGAALTKSNPFKWVRHEVAISTVVLE